MAGSKVLGMGPVQYVFRASILTGYKQAKSYMEERRKRAFHQPPAQVDACISAGGPACSSQRAQQQAHGHAYSWQAGGIIKPAALRSGAGYPFCDSSSEMNLVLQCYSPGCRRSKADMAGAIMILIICSSHIHFTAVRVKHYSIS